MAFLCMEADLMFCLEDLWKLLRIHFLLLSLGLVLGLEKKETALFEDTWI